MISVVAGSERNLYLKVGFREPLVGVEVMVEVELVSARQSWWALVHTVRRELEAIGVDRSADRRGVSDLIMVEYGCIEYRERKKFKV